VVSQRLDFASASREYCMATGEFAYAEDDLVAAVQKTPQQKADKLDTTLKRLIGVIKRETAQARRYGDLGIRTASVAGEGGNMVGRFNDVAHCRR
jgi:hypothetical protein